jgi:hypothetical protein
LTQKVKRAKPSYAPQWAAFLAVLAVAAAIYHFPIFPRKVPVARASKAGESDSLLILHFPEMPTEEVGAAGTRVRVREWLEALLSQGYQPVRLSDALMRLKSRQSLPERAFAVVFSPGYRRTYDGLAPILTEYRCPASWITDRAFLAAGNQEYLSSHAVSAMRHDRFWEPGYFEASTTTFSLHPVHEDRWAGWAYRFPWSPGASRRALNRYVDLKGLHRLNLNLSWTGPQLVERLDAETPIRRPVLLTAKRRLGQMLGGYVEAASTSAAAAFDLETPPDVRSVPVAWQGVSGWNDVRMELSAASVVGDLWVYLRYDQDEEEGLQVGFTRSSIEVIWSNEGRLQTLAAIPWTFTPDRPIKATISLAGSRLELDVNGVRRVVNGVPPIAQEDSGIAMLAVRSKLRGVARAGGVSVFLSPL